MGTHIIKMPDIGEGIVEVELVAWRVQPGDQITEDQIVADVMTDKATVEIPSPVHGKVLALGGEAGQLMAVGSELVRIEVDGDTVAVAPPPAAAPVAPAPAPAPTAAVAKPVAPHPASRSPIERAIASPSVRRRAWELGIDIQQVRPSGAGGRVMHEDLEAHAARHGSSSPMQPIAARPAPLAARDGEEAIKIVGLRRKIAQKMAESKRRIPHFTYVEEIDVTELELLRARLNAQHAATRGKLTVLPLLVRAIVNGLRDFPQINARLDDEQGVVTRYGAVHLGVAAQTPAGLMVPVLRHAETHDLWSCAAEIARLAEAARSGRATRDELNGSTITLTSLGALGGIMSTPVINHPEVAIVGVNRIVERPVMRNGAVVGRQMMNLSSSFDHRVVDGQHAAEFIQVIRGMLECPAALFVD
ncbi:dihydrolipoamide acetyltransferase family protein [Roseateles toxinivorans]|uniref:Dihydrolipoamide acetyltransferase component of pyruvate dehydrogenase complex n=1 Tax=Roseateles toxinivorans TaxID=270368 RepID=A0A4R6QJL5_9BURK|nr:dihydrolipoamide acetyltransferase family protein [Roseateles toxinivorans]TDP62561.1 branched-chain alpha-keto acid dehydrogenase E2 component [Roseateles toxinivorans]